MPFKRVPQRFSATVGTLTLGSGEHTVTIGGQNVLPLYAFDGDMHNRPAVAVEILDDGFDGQVDGICDYYTGASDLAAVAALAEKMQGADLVCLTLRSADPGGADASPELCAANARAVFDAIHKPLIIAGCGNADKDAAVFGKIAAELQGENILFLSATEDNYKSVGAAAGLAYGHKVGAESAVDINLAKQLNVLLTQLGVRPDNIAANLGSAAVGYGFEYVASTIERVRSAALGQGDAMLAMPIVTPVSSETWTVKESLVDQSDLPEWGRREPRGVAMEVSTAAACLASGSDAVIVRHPQTVKTIAKLIESLTSKALQRNGLR